MFLAVEAVLFGLYLLLGVPEAHAEQYRVETVSNGDTLPIEPVMGGDRAKVRLLGIDAQSYGNRMVKATYI